MRLRLTVQVSYVHGFYISIVRPSFILWYLFHCTFPHLVHTTPPQLRNIPSMTNVSDFATYSSGCFLWRPELEAQTSPTGKQRRT
ncbi:hypothetical protein BXZ70DRAFT_952966 [Cristinia sonorae]|uniref:Uncharacterized protein n=1 Tax=Cristinia sonorae TaxID=1940300 RepID=A0A8K0UH60_9AGAR|nr:hypothetical protein BXZ70DRAFT_952966 [Cristinia sonorae]